MIFRHIKSVLAITFNIPPLYAKTSFSQEGEDLILQKIFHNKNKGFYVDIGAHHPFRYSNTYLLYKRGWKGINIDASPNVAQMFDKTRSCDTNLNIAVSNSKQSALYIFEDSALNTLSKTNAESTIKSGQSKLIKKVQVKTKKLSDILEKYANRQKIDFMNIDVEGLELEVLKSNNWRKYKPQALAVENILSTNKKISKFLKEKGYRLVAKTISTQIYQLQ